MKNVFLYIIFFSVTLSSCGFYKFNGIDIPSDVKTYYVDNFQLTAQNAPGDLNQRFAEALRAKVTTNLDFCTEKKMLILNFLGPLQILPSSPKHRKLEIQSRLTDLKSGFLSLIPIM